MTGVPRKLRVPDLAAMKQRGERALPWSRDFSRKTYRGMGIALQSPSGARKY